MNPHHADTGEILNLAQKIDRRQGKIRFSHEPVLIKIKEQLERILAELLESEGTNPTTTAARNAKIAQGTPQKVDL